MNATDYAAGAIMCAAALVVGYTLGWIRGRRAGAFSATLTCLECVREALFEANEEERNRRSHNPELPP